MKLNESINLPSGLYLKFFAIAPEGSKYGAWPYCLEYSFNSIDYFGLATFGSNVRINDPSEVETKVKEIIEKHDKYSAEANEVAKLGSREPSLGDKYKLIFSAPGLSHRGTYFESWRDMERYVSWVMRGQEHVKDLEARVFLTVSGDPIGRFMRVGDKIVTQTEVKS